MAERRTWAVLVDGDVDRRCRTRREAREHAAWLRRTPEVRDRRRFGHGGVVAIRDLRGEEEVARG